MITPPPFDPFAFSVELLFTIISIVFCFSIYFKTKETYELTRYQGIMYFRKAFLFFGLSYAMRFLFSFLMFSRMAFDLILPRELFVPLFILPLGYFSTIGIFYLIFSLIWKKLDNKKVLFLGHGIAVVLSVLSFITRSHLILLLLQSILLIIAAALSFTTHKGRKKISQIKILYLLILALWLIDLWIIDRRHPFSLSIQLASYLISLLVFIAIYYKISKWVK